MIQGGIMKKGILAPQFFLHVTLLFWLFWLNPLKAQDLNVSADKGFFMLDFNQTPDSVFVNDQLVGAFADSVYTIQPGYYEFRAFSKCAYSITSKIQILPKRVKRVILRFEHQSTPESRLYNRMKYINYFYSSIGIIGGLVVDTGTEFVLPLSIIGLSEHFIWKPKVKSGFDFCTGEYLAENFKTSDFNIMVGLTSEIFGEVITHTTSVDSKRFNSSIPYNITWDATEKTVFRSSSSVSSGYALSIGVEKSVSRYFSLTASSDIYPFTEIKVYRDDKTRFFNAEGNYSYTAKKPLLRFNLDLNVRYFQSLDQEWSFSIGAYFSNTISGSVEFPATMPNLILLRDSTYSKTYEYKFSSAGFKTGISTIYHVADNFSLFFNYFFYMPYKFEANGITERSFFLTVNIGTLFFL